MQKSNVWSSVGGLLMIAAVAMLVPAAVGIYYDETEYGAFLLCAVLTMAVGALLWYCMHPDKNRRRKHRMPVRDGYAILAYGWLAVVLFSMVPYLITGTVSNITDAFFESMSGFTMTGATVLADVEAQARCVLLWRSMTQWLGGLGILVLFIALLNGHNHDALQVLCSDGTGITKQKFHSRSAETALGLAFIYTVHTILVIVLYCAAGMSLFDGVNHGLTVVSAGGFSVKNAGLGFYQTPAILYVTTVAMFLTGINYTLFIHGWRNKTLHGFQNSLELKVYVGAIVFASAAIAWFVVPASSTGVLDTMGLVVFQAVSVITTAGFVIGDIEAWAAPAQLLLILLMMCGACAGSVGGSIQIDRHVIMLQKVVQEVRRFLHPNLVTRLKSNGQMVDDDVILSINTFFYIYMVLIVIGSAVLSLLGIELLGAVTAAISCLGGIGPAMGLSQWAMYYGDVPALGKWLLSLLMLVGRLEVYTVLVMIPTIHRSSAQRRKNENESLKSLTNLNRDGMLEPWVIDDDD